ncbi:MAG: portal protein [Roseobacter sp.]
MKEEKHEDLLKMARDRMAEAVDADQENRLEQMDDLEKLVGDQWPNEIRTEREADQKPCLTINRLPQFVRQVTGDIRRMNPAINVTPADGKARKETAEVIEGLIRHIEYRSDASSVYEQSAESAAACSVGYFRVLNEWENDESFDQEILIKRIRNPFSVYFDPNAEMPTREDADFVFITSPMRKEDFKKEYPKASISDAPTDGSTDGLENWMQQGQIVVAEYYWKEPVTRTIWQLQDDTITDVEPQIPEYVTKKRKVQTHKVMWAKVTAHEVLEGPTEQPTKHIPVLAVTGEEWHVGERVRRSSVIRYAKDSQQMYNYWRSASTEVVALQPKAPYMVTVKQIKGLETFWNAANKKNRPYLPYNPDDKAGAPSRAQPPVSSSGMMQEIMNAAEDMKATTGIYDAGLGNSSSEKSGVAIRQRQMESDVATSIYSDNMAKAIAACGRIIIDMIPTIYDTKRTVRILGKDDKEQMVPINDIQVAMGPNGPETQPINDLTIGKYDVRVSVGPNYSTRRQETSEGMLEFVRSFPGAAQITGDLVAKSMDWPDADQFAERLEKMLPPEMRDNSDLSPEEQQKMQQGMAQQQQQQKMQQEMQQIDMRKAGAEAQEAEADAQKTAVEAAQAQLELALQSGQMNEAIGQIVQEQVARALQGAFAQQGRF